MDYKWRPRSMLAWLDKPRRSRGDSNDAFFLKKRCRLQRLVCHAACYTVGVLSCNIFFMAKQSRYIDSKINVPFVVCEGVSAISGVPRVNHWSVAFRQPMPPLSMKIFQRFDLVTVIILFEATLMSTLFYGWIREGLRGIIYPCKIIFASWI